MARYVVYRLFEDQEEVPPLIRVELNRFRLRGNLKVPLDPPRLEHVRDELSDSGDQTSQIVASRVNRPDDIPHRAGKTACRIGNFGQDRKRLSGATQLALDHFTQDGHPRETGANVVVQI